MRYAPLALLGALAVGLAAGALGSGLLGSDNGNGRGGVLAAPGLPVGPGGAADTEGARATEGDELARLRAEVATLRARLDDSRRAADPTAIDPEASETADGPGGDVAEADPAPEDTVNRELQALIDLALEDPVIKDYFRGRPDEMLWWLTQAYIETGRPLEALALVEAAQPVDPDMFSMVAQSLAANGQTLLAAQAFAKALAENPSDGYTVSQLADLDPGLALATLRDAIAQQPPPGDPMSRLQLATVLQKSGDKEAALEMLNSLSGELGRDSDFIQAFIDTDPEAARAHLEALMRASGDDGGTLRSFLVRLHLDNGRAAEARALIDQVLGENPFHDEARRALFELDPEAGLAFLKQSTAANPDAPGLWNELGERLQEQGRTNEAIDAWMTAFRNSPGSSPWEWQLLEHAPQLLIPEYEASTFGSNDDELWGDLADAYWKVGRKEDARGAWEKARSIDPGDGEWTGKLSALNLGKDPISAY